MTAREAEVLALIARHLTNAQIADALFISQRTVESHVSAMLRKLQLADRRSLARHAEAIPGLLVKSGRRGLPVPVTPFVGRTAERAALAAALAEHRMVTATGPGGVGKTRLALSVAADLASARRDGVWFVDLVHVTDPAMVTAAVAETVGVPEQRTTSVDLALVASLADAATHCSSSTTASTFSTASGPASSGSSRAAPRSPCWRPAGPGSSSRTSGCTSYRGCRSSAAVAMLSTCSPPGWPPRRATPRRRTPCGWRRCAGRWTAWRWPSSWPRPGSPALGLDGLESGLDQRLRFLTVGTARADRHGSLREAIGWSYDLLSADDRALLRGVAVFASWFDVDAARAVAGAGRERAEIADGLARLAEHSLLVVERGEPTRYRALETIRQYGVEQLDQAGELDQTRADHERWCRLAVAALRRSETADIDEAWCDRFDRVADDVACRPHLVRRRREPTGAGGGRWPASLPVCCSSAAGRRRHSGGTSRPPISRRR